MKTNLPTLARYCVVFICVWIRTSSILAMTDSPQKPVPVPLINQPLVPDAIVPGGGDFTLVVNGTGFTPRSVVKWDGHPRATTFVSYEQLTTVIAASDIATANTGSVTVTTNGAGGGTSNVVYFPVTLPTSSVSFTESDVAGGVSSSPMLAGDFNEDANVDLALPEVFGDIVNVLLGNGDGTFQPYVTYPTGVRPLTIGSGDFNEDGHLDLVTNGRGVVCILPGDGDGTFGPHADFGTIPAEGENLQTGDLNGDGHLDVVIANGLAGSVSVFLGNGDGTLQPAIAYTTGHFPQNIAAGDYDRDGHVDLAVVSGKSSQNPIGLVLILLGKGDGSFRKRSRYEMRGTGSDIITADFNGDDILDLAATDPSQEIVSILLGNGDGTFQSRLDYPTAPGPIRLATGDLNGDGYLDIAVPCPSHGAARKVSTLLGKGDGTFQPYSTHDAQTFPNDIVIADFDRDGRLDLAASCGFETVSILLQNSTDRRFSPPRQVAPAMEGRP